MLFLRSLTVFISFFFLNSIPQQWFPPICLPVHLFILLPHLFCQFLLAHFFVSVIILFISVCLFFKGSNSLLNISCILLVSASILFPRSWIVFAVTTLNSFSGRLPLSLHLVVVPQFYFIPHFSAVSFCLTFCICRLRSSGCSTVILLGSGVCTLMGEAGPGACARSWWEELIPAHWWMELDLVALVGRTLSKGVFTYCC